MSIKLFLERQKDTLHFPNGDFVKSSAYKKHGGKYFRHIYDFLGYCEFPMTSRRIAELCQMNQRTVQRYLKQLEDKGLVAHVDGVYREFKYFRTDSEMAKKIGK